MPRTSQEWAHECAYISDTTDAMLVRAEAQIDGVEPKLAAPWPDIDLFVSYCAMMKSLAKRQGFHEAAIRIGDCLDNLTDQPAV